MVLARSWSARASLLRDRGDAGARLGKGERLHRRPHPLRLRLDQATKADRVGRLRRLQAEPPPGVILGGGQNERLDHATALALLEREEQAAKPAVVARRRLAVHGILALGVAALGTEVHGSDAVGDTLQA